jgi:hypothetical protein
MLFASHYNTINKYKLYENLSTIEDIINKQIKTSWNDQENYNVNYNKNYIVNYIKRKSQKILESKRNIYPYFVNTVNKIINNGINTTSLMHLSYTHSVFRITYSDINLCYYCDSLVHLILDNLQKITKNTCYSQNASIIVILDCFINYYDLKLKRYRNKIKKHISLDCIQKDNEVIFTINISINLAKKYYESQVKKKYISHLLLKECYQAIPEYSDQSKSIFLV